MGKAEGQRGMGQRELRDRVAEGDMGQRGNCTKGTEWDGEGSEGWSREGIKVRGGQNGIEW